ncbi:MAG: flagellar hook-associated protein FlgK [Nitrospira sp.]|nr:flagellar hook-associated protein FlgK [Nitrospira sp.]MBP6605558.1 flagellar hook-associated protein FlgK [Nitrospira sp.]HQY57543.1 flagellar hook-associated protein FlgK [Nitrospira sp.]HRA95426.1 flagellar hook-associated protein FlgK [Nitrospira sp.]
MSGLNGLFGVGSNALAAFQRALSVTGQNIANVSTPGYSRQELILTESLPENGRPGQIGTGVTASEIRRSVDSFVDQQLLGSHERIGQFGASQKALTQIQLVFNDSNNQGIAAGLNEFFKAWQDVATNPADLTARTVLLTKADGVTKLLNQAASQLSAQRLSLDGQVQSSINDVNGLASKIADLNREIKLTEVSGQQANDLRDQRGRYLNELAELVDISSIEDGTGQVTVFVGTGQVLVTEQTAFKLTGVPDVTNSGLLDVRYDGGTGPNTDITSAISGGRLKGLIDARDTTAAGLQTSLDTLASQLVSQVNTQHRLGYGLDGSTTQDFFLSSGTTAGSISLALTDRQKIAASSTAAGVPGNNVNALALSNLQTAAVAGLGNTTFQGYYSAMAGSFGGTLQGATRDLQGQEILHDQLLAHRAEVSGVSMDEELINLLKYQRAFEAASKLITTSDEMLQTILSLKR